MPRPYRPPPRPPALATLASALALALLGASPLACQKNQVVKVLPAGQRIDLFPQAARAQLDALFVVDNSRYMGVHQARVAASFGRFQAWLDQNQIDAQVGLLSSDVYASPGAFLGGGGNHFFSGAGPLAGLGALPGAVLALGGKGSAVSAVLEQLDLALAAPPAGFLRPSAALFLVVVTDNDDPWSPGADAFYVRRFKAAKGLGNDGVVTLSVVAGDLPKGCSIPDPQTPGQSFFAEPAARLRSLAASLGGRSWSLCAPDFDAVFDELGATAAGLQRAFRLDQQPDPATIEVTVRAACDTRPAALALCASLEDQCASSAPWLLCTPRMASAGPPAVAGATYDPATRSILFPAAAPPPRGSEVLVSYQPLGSAP
jgi:peptidoglycan hydrolase-like protein with peptidoglycan-binding domain